MSYTTVTVIVDGAFDTEENFETDNDLWTFVESVRKDAATDGQETEVYLLQHEHNDDGEECSCVQYLTDHRPAYHFNAN